jgi:tetratricopeptide (TPR) repeat protein
MTAEAPSERLPAIESAYAWFLGLGVLASVLAVGFIAWYSIYGRLITEELDAACAEAAFESGKKLEKQGNFEAAIVRYRQALTGRFNDVKKADLCGLSLGDLLYKLGRYDEAVEAYRALRPEAFSHAGAYTGFANALYRANRRAEARATAEAWLAQAEKEANVEQELWAHDLLMRIAADEKNFDAVEKHAKAQLALDPSSPARLFWAQRLREQQRVPEALQEVQEFLRLSKDAKLLDQALRIEKELRDTLGR